MTLNNEEHKISLKLTQEETLALTPGNAFAQIRFLYNDGTAFVSERIEFVVKDVENDEVME